MYQRGEQRKEKGYENDNMIYSDALDEMVIKGFYIKRRMENTDIIVGMIQIVYIGLMM